MGPTMSSQLLEKAFSLMESEEFGKLLETAKFFYQNDSTTINLYPAVVITGLLLLLLIPLLGSLPSIDLFPSFSSPSYGSSSGYGAPAPSSGYGAPSTGYGPPARQSWGGPADYRSFQNEAGDDLKDVYNNANWEANSDPVYNVARSLNVEASTGSTLLADAVKQLQ